jgi:hypothetical protein
MTAHAIARARPRKAPVLTWPFVFLLIAVAAAAAFISDMLWPNWPSEPGAIDAPALPITVAGALFQIPPAAIRAPVQRHPGQHDRVDLVFSWPDLMPPLSKDGARDKTPLDVENAISAIDAAENDRIFVTIAGLNGTLPPLDRLHTIYPRYVAARASAGPDGLVVLPFRDGTPYQGEDLVYVGASPEQFFARCTHGIDAVRGTCISERALEGAQIGIRFPRDWLADWRGVATAFDRLAAQLHPAKS